MYRFICDSDLLDDHIFASLLNDDDAAFGVVGADEVDVLGRVDGRWTEERRAKRNVGVFENDSHLRWDSGSDSHADHLKNKF